MDWEPPESKLNFSDFQGQQQKTQGNNISNTVDSDYLTMS